MAQQSLTLKQSQKKTASSPDEKVETPVALDILEGVPARYRAWHDFLGKRIGQVLEEFQPAIKKREELRGHGMSIIEEDALNYFAAIKNKWLCNPTNVEDTEVVKALAEDETTRLKKAYHQVLDIDKTFLKKIREALTFITTENLKVFICICISGTASPHFYICFTGTRPFRDGGNGGRI